MLKIKGHPVVGTLCTRLGKQAELDRTGENILEGNAG